MKTNLNVYFRIICGPSKGFMKAFKTFIKPFQAPGSDFFHLKKFSEANFLPSYEIGTGMAKEEFMFD